MKTQVSAGIIAFRDNNGMREYLLLHYPHGHWDLPKGKQERDESLQQTTQRELHEETGLTAQLIDGFEERLKYTFRHAGQLIKKTVVYFVGRASQGKVLLSDEHIGFEWLAYQQALERLTFENSKRVFAAADTFLEHKKTGN